MDEKLINYNNQRLVCLYKSTCEKISKEHFLDIITAIVKSTHLSTDWVLDNLVAITDFKDDLGMDSIGLIDMYGEIEKKLKLDIYTLDRGDVFSFNDLIQVIEKKYGE